MWHASATARGGAALALAAALICTPACSYFRNRGRDALEMFDIGFTFTKKPQFGLYGNCPFTVPGGYAKVDGYYAGIGGGKVGVMEHHQDTAGALMWGRENVTWGAPDSEGGEGGGEFGVGPLGLATDAEGNPVYRPQCAHYLHLGFIGVTANVNYKEIGDFFAGWAGFDITHDDNRAARLASRQDKLRDLSLRISRPHGGLQLLVHTSKPAYGPDEPIQLDVYLVNRTGASRTYGDKPRDLSVYFEPVAKNARGEPSEWLLRFHAYEVYTGRQRYGSEPLKVPPERRGELYHHMTLPPNAFVGRRFTFAPPRHWLPPGEHFFLVTYEVPQDSGFVILRPDLPPDLVDALGTDLAYARVWTGKLYSNLAAFRVQRRATLWPF